MTKLPTTATCRGGARTSPGFARRWRMPMIIGGVILAGMAAALWQQWLTVGALAPLLFVLPCALMMFVCMRHMNHSQPSDPQPSDPQPSDPQPSDPQPSDPTSALAERAGGAGIRS